jgi:hypothetical protein
MIRLRSAFLVVLLSCVLAFCLGLHAGFYSARSATLAEGMKKWTDEMTSAATLGRYGTALQGVGPSGQ